MRLRFNLIVLATAVTLLIVVLAAFEMHTSWLQAHLLARTARDMRFETANGPSPQVVFPRFGPYEERLGYTRIETFTRRLQDLGFEVSAQARMSEPMLAMIRNGLYPAWREKERAGLQLLDSTGTVEYASRYPKRTYRDFADVPPVLVRSLLFLEDRDLLETAYPMHNPAVDWTRFGRAVLDQGLHLVLRHHHTPGGSTLATQIEKFRHSPGGRTTNDFEKLRQMASASVRAYLGGSDTRATRHRIVVQYLDSVPLSAMRGYGEVDGIGDGLWVWYGRDFEQVNTLLRGIGTHAVSARQALAYKQALSLMLAQRSPSYYLIEHQRALEKITDVYLRLLAHAGVIAPAVRDAALAHPLQLRTTMPSRPAVAFVQRKASTSSRVRLAMLLAEPRLYVLDRLDLLARTTLNDTAQHEVTQALLRARDAAGARKEGLYGYNMLHSTADPSHIQFSFTLYETCDGANLLRVQTDSADMPFDVNQGARLNLGSTAKLRTIVTYLQIIAALHDRYASMSRGQLQRVSRDPEDALAHWALEYLSSAKDRGLLPMLDAAMQRKYSANPAEAFFTGGSWQRFSNFEPEDNHLILSVADAFEHSVNLVFVRLMRDIVHHEMYEIAGSTASILANPALRHMYLERFAQREGSVFVARFYRQYYGHTPQQIVDLLTQEVRPLPKRMAVVMFGVDPQASPAAFAEAMRRAMPEASLPDDALRRLYDTTVREHLSLSDQGYVAGVHPLELWVAAYLRAHPDATLTQTLAASRQARLDVYLWLFRTHHANRQDLRIRVMVELEAYLHIAKMWRALGYPFSSITPSYGSAVGAAGDRPAALAELMGIIVNDGLRLPMRQITALTFGAGTPYETRLVAGPPKPERLLPAAICQVVRQALVGVVQAGTGMRARGAFGALAFGGKTGTGDQRFQVYSPHGHLLQSRRINRTATFVFFIGTRWFGTISAYAHEPYAATYHYTSAMTVQLLKDLSAELSRLSRYTT
jgi:membrane peptidoglycan carboxypeptidase